MKDEILSPARARAGDDSVDTTTSARHPGPLEPARVRPDEQLGARMSRLPRRDTAPEMALRRELHRRGLRYRLQVPVPTARRRTIDVAFTRARVAVFVDGCFWHGCDEHGVRPDTNKDWWRWKIDRNQARDQDTTERLEADGWSVLRVWEHTEPREAAALVEAMVRARSLTQSARRAGAEAPQAPGGPPARP